MEESVITEAGELDALAEAGELDALAEAGELYDTPEKPKPDVERLAPVPESTVTVRGEGVGGHCNMTASEYRDWNEKRRKREEEEVQVEADAEAAANEVRMDAKHERKEKESEADRLDAEERELAELEAAEANPSILSED